MYRKTLVLVAAAALAAALAAAATPGQTTRPAPVGRYVGRVVGTDVYVRSGPVDGYPCTRLSRPATVHVIGEHYGWLKVLPPRDCHSLISKRYVRADGNVGTLTGNNVLVRAGSKLYPTRKEAIQTRLGVGDKVAILGESGEYYKIVPPRGTFLWISARYVRAAGRAVTTQAVLTPPTPPTPATPATPATPRVAVAPSTRDRVTRDVAAFEAAERALAAEFKKPRDARDLQALLRKYEALASAKQATLAPYVQARIQFLTSEVDLTRDLSEVESLVDGVRAKQADLIAERGRVKLPTTRPAQMYAAEGVLAPSGLFKGGPTGPKRFTISDPDTRVIYAYVQCTTGLVDLSRHVSAYVGIVGKPKFDKRLRTYVIEAERIIVLRAPGAEGRPEPRTVLPPRPVAPEPPPVTTRPAEPEPVAPKPKTVAPKPKPVAPKPKPVAPEPKPVAPEPAPRPPWDPGPGATTKPADEKPLPATGLPVAEPTTKPAGDPVNPAEYE